MSSSLSGGVSVGHPVDVASGVLSNTYRDARLTGRPPLAFVRSYSTALKDREGGLGRGWAGSFDHHVRATIEGYRWSTPGGGAVDFVDLGGAVDGGGKVRDLGSFSEITRVGPNWVVTQWSPSGAGATRFAFPVLPVGRTSGPLWIQDAQGDGLEITRDRAERIASVRQVRGGRRLEFHYDGVGHLIRVSAVATSTRVLARYSYDDDGRLVAFTDVVGGTAQYAYDTRGRLVQEVARDGSRWVFAFDDEGRCTRTTGQDGYDEKRLRYDTAARRTVVTDARGAVWTYDWNEVGQVVRTESPLGRVALHAFDEYGRPKVETAPTGATHEFAYDEAGNRSEIKDPRGNVTRFKYDDEHRLIEFVDKAGSQWLRRHDARGKLIEVTNPVGGIFRIAWSRDGDLERVEGPEGMVRRYFTSPTGDVIAFAAKADAAFRYEYDEWGYLLSSRDPLGNVTRRTRDARGLLTVVTWADGTITRNEYTPSGVLARTIDRDGTVRTYRSATCSGRWGVVELGRRKFRFGWEDEPSLLQTIVNPNGETWRFEYDDDQRLVCDVGYDGTETRYEYDDKGRLVARTVGGETTRFVHDLSGAVAKALFADGAHLEMEYDRMGRVSEVSDGASTVRFERDPLGCPVLEDTGDFQVTRQFDALGRLIARSTSLGFQTTTELDDAGRPVTVTVGGQSIKFTYDGLGREVARQFQGGAALHSTWDSMHRLVEQRVTTAPTATATAGAVTGTLLQRHYSYSAGDKLLAVEDERWGRSTYSYDADGRLISASLSRVTVEGFDYDAAGNLTAFSDSRPSTTPGIPGEHTEVKRRLAPGGRLESENGLGFRYDSVGRLAKMTAGVTGPAWEYRWDARGRLIEVRLPNDERYRYGYDAFDRRTFKEGPSGRTEYRWDGDRLVHEIASNGTTANWELTVGRLTPVAKQEAGKTYFAITDQIGAPRELVSGDGALAWSALLSPRGAVSAFAAQTTTCDLRLPGQWWDADVALSYNRFRYYSPSRVQFLSRDPLAHLFDFNAYAYPNDPLFWIDPLGLLAEVLYPAPDALGRPQGATALVTPADVGTGTQANSAIQPPGFEGGGHPAHHERGHLIPNQLGGDGNDPRNLVTVTGGTNHPGMANVEAQVAAHVASGKYVEYTATPVYEGDNPVPVSVKIKAVDLETGAVIAEAEVENGQHKNYAGCSH